MEWDEFEAACPEIGRLARERLAKDELVMLGTLRRDGSPRISPCEVDFAGGRIFFGMMWHSMKALDLRRDPRLVVHSVTRDRAGTDGDIKLYGRAIEVFDAPTRELFRETVQARLDWAPEEPQFHVFALDVERAGYAVFDDERQRTMVWEPSGGLRVLDGDG
jgi:general stress protein 26